jgi:hypothetical protein
VVSFDLLTSGTLLILLSATLKFSFLCGCSSTRCWRMAPMQQLECGKPLTGVLLRAQSCPSSGLLRRAEEDRPGMSSIRDRGKDP